MPKRKNKPPTIDEVRTLKRQFEDYAQDLVTEFEAVTGLKVERIEVSRRRKIGFGEGDETTINLITEI